MESMAPDTELDIDEGDLENLESEVKQMAKKISEYRQTLPDLLRNTLDSALSSLVPVIPNVDAETQASVVVGTEVEQDCREKMIRLKEIMSRNAANIPKVVKRMRDCIERMDKLDSLDVTTIHPAFFQKAKN
ncbi:PREDICTED: uncharacterized protein LOC104712005 [Camelina sativa]|uniref:Uncharacterized protein LOC104712005 n=1 Tax=Camelina sativa TaxID=90675 RepID=A0ABM0TIZ6_CAMSA|nr:PREDICTED: uncharacterized protein LOC104712005 [Camelina sativa]